MALNVFSLFKDLLPDQPLYVGTVQSISNGVATIQLPGGALLTARGDATVGTRVFFRDGLIEGTAPSLTSVTIDI